MRMGKLSAAAMCLAMTPLLVVPAGAAPAPSDGEASSTVALWDPDFSPHLGAADCETWGLDERGFCTADDTRNGVELGTKFQTSQELRITGVRIYRVDPGTVTGSLWSATGTRLATGSLAPAATTGWQDLAFDRAVTISPGRTYVASYYSPATKYAFQYGFFRQQLDRGPVTALRAVDGDPNGVHCYDVATLCRFFPIRGFRDASYWVSPLWEIRVGEPVPPPAASSTPSDVTPPTVQAARPTWSSTPVGRGKSIRITFSELLRSSLLTRDNVRLLRKGRPKPLPVRLRYDNSRNRLTVDPVRLLRPRTTYRVVIATRLMDVAGNRLDQDSRRAGAQRATWTFRTR